MILLLGLWNYEQAGNWQVRLLCSWILFVRRQTVIQFNGPKNWPKSNLVFEGKIYNTAWKNCSRLIPESHFWLNYNDYLYSRPTLLGLGTHLFVKVLDQETAKWPFRFSSQAATCYYQSNYSKVEAIPLSVLPKDTKSELAGLSPR